MTTRVDRLITMVADQLGATIEAIAPGGEFGAAFVRDTDGVRMVLKAVPGRDRAKQWERGIQIAERLRDRGYPTPRYRGTGVIGDAVWSLQELLPGGVPTRLDLAHVEQLLSLAEFHADLVPSCRPVGSEEPRVELSIRGAQQLQADTRTAAVGAQIERVLLRTKRCRRRGDDACHGDFHHRNLTVEGDEVLGVFDWEGASCGDWRFDVATLAFWSCVAVDQVSDAARSRAVERAAELCGPALLALYTGCLSARVLTFFRSHRPEHLDGVLGGVAAVSEWW